MIIAVDGGATKTLGLVFDPNDLKVKGLGLAGPTNLTTVSKREIVSNLEKVILESCQSARIDVGELERGLFGIAGVGDSEKTTRFGKETVSRLTGRHDFQVINDGLPAYVMANLYNDGVVFAAGTGSVCFFKRGKRIERKGGWGWFSGDDGSASWIAKRGLNLATKEFDGILKQRLLSKEVEDYFNCGFRDAISLAETKTDKRFISGFAPSVTKLASHGYLPAISIMEESAEYVSSLINSLVSKFSGSPRISIVGGTMMAGNFYIDMIRKKIGHKLNIYYGYQVASGGLLHLMNEMGHRPTFELRDSILAQIDELLYRKSKREIRLFLNFDKEWKTLHTGL